MFCALIINTHVIPSKKSEERLKIEISRTENHPHRRQEISGSLLIRLINETIKRIRKDAALMLVPSREETLSASFAYQLERAGIPLENDADDPLTDTSENATIPAPALPPLTPAEIKTALDGIPGLSVVEKVIFADELQWLCRKEQDEFLELLKN